MDYFNWNVTFPAITLCPVNKIGDEVLTASVKYVLMIYILVMLVICMPTSVFAFQGPFNTLKVLPCPSVRPESETFYSQTSTYYYPEIVDIDVLLPILV